MTAVIIIIIAILLIIAANSKKKASITHKQTTTNYPTSSRKTTVSAFEATLKYFGSEWQSWLLQQSASFRLPDDFYETVAFAIENISPADHKDLLLSFLKSTTQSGTSDGIALSVGFNNYEPLHIATYALLKSGRFSEPSMTALLRQLAQQKRQQREEVKMKEQQDESIIDVTGEAYKLDVAPEPNGSGYQPNVQQQTQYTYTNNYDPNEYRLGKLYKEKLGLSNQEVSWLNKFWYQSNVFLSIEGCCIETIRLYLATLKELNKQLKKKETTIAKEIEAIQAEIQKVYPTSNLYYWEGTNSSTYYKERAESEVFGTIFKRAEKSVREAFGHKRKVSGDFPYPNQQLNQSFENRIGLAVNQIIQTLSGSIASPDERTEAELNTQNTNRWKIKFEQLQQSLSETNSPEFIDGIYALEKQNQKNPAIENIFFEASKCLAKYDKTAALKFYIYYLYYDLKSDRIDNKQLTKTIQKSLFTTNEQLHDFEKAVADLVKTKNLQAALQAVTKIHQPKRKKIQLDVAAITEVQQQDKGTVELLSEYLKDEFEDEGTSIKTEQINSEEIRLDISSAKTDQKKSFFTDGIYLNKVQSDALTLFADKSFMVPLIEVDSYCKSKGIFKNQLIDSINESCYEVLDDVLIEEEGDNFVINEDYYRKISAQ